MFSSDTGLNAFCKDRPSPVDRQGNAGHEVVVDKKENGLRDVLRMSLSPDPRRIDRLLALRLREIDGKEDRAGEDAVDTDTWIPRPQFTASVRVNAGITPFEGK